MISIFKKEIRQFFSSIIGYIVIVLYLLVNGIMLWIFPESSIIDNGFATLDQYFYIAPWLLIFLISAITMRMFSDEFKSGNMEILDTLPIPTYKVILGKFLASFILILLSIMPTIIYIFSIRQLAYLPQNVDYGSMIGSYIGISFLAMAFTAIGIFSSSLSQNQIVAFLISLVLCLFFYSALDSLSLLPAFQNGLDYVLQHIGMSFHYNSINKGVLDSRDIVYFLSITLIFLFLTLYSLESKKWEKTELKNEKA